MLKILDFLVDLFFPVQCLICQAEGTDICNHCITHFKWPKRKHHPWIHSLWNYRDPDVEKIMRHIKSMPNDRVAGIVATLFFERILNRPENPEEWIFIPIPINKKRFRERGYNQSELLARALGEEFSFPVIAHALVKIKNTKKQGTTKSREERLQNAVGSFGITNPSLIAGKKVIIVDDITTTGSTLVEAYRALQNAGAKKVMAWTVAN